MRIGICAESSGLAFRQLLPWAAELKIGGILVEGRNEFAPHTLTDSAKREIRNLLKTYNLQFTALSCPLRHGIDVAENQQPRLDAICQVMTLAFELGPRVVVVPFPRLPAPEETDRADRLKDALTAIGKHGDRIGTRVALEIGIDPPDKVRDYLLGFDLGSLGINYDPTNLLLHGHDPVRGLLSLANSVVHIHARDARSSTVSRSAQEVPLGVGNIDWLSFAGTLAALDYRGWVVVKRDSGTRRREDVAAGVEVLRRVIPG